LVVYNITCKEGVALYMDEDCPKAEITESIWLILDVNEAELANLECGDVETTGGSVIADAWLFKAWKLGRHRFYGSASLLDEGDMTVYILDRQLVVVTELCDATCVMEGKLGRDNSVRSLKGCCIIDGATMIGEGICSARLDRRLMRRVEKLELTSIDDILGYLQTSQSLRAQEVDICDPFGGT
jgi:hypothetical protein